jgi:hypothetical protein
MLTGASIAYALTTGGCNAELISITPLGMRIVRTSAENDDIAAKREALLRPRVIREFLQRYNNAPVPREAIARNVLTELGVPQDRTADVLSLILENANALGFLQEIKDKSYIDLGVTSTASEDDPRLSDGEEAHQEHNSSSEIGGAAHRATAGVDIRQRRVFITHGKNRNFVEPLKQLLTFGELQAVVANEKLYGLTASSQESDGAHEVVRRSYYPRGRRAEAN